MQILYDYDNQYRVNSTGSRNLQNIAIRYQSQPTLELHIQRNTAGVLAGINVTDALTWTCAIDKDKNISTVPMCRTLSVNIDKTGAATGLLLIPIDANTAQFLAAVNGLTTGLTVYFELKGYNEAGKEVYYILFTMKAEMIVDALTEPGPDTPDNTITEAEARALLMSAPEVQFSVDGLTGWHDTQTDADRWYRERRLGGEWSTAFAIIVPPQLPTHSFTNADLVAGILTVPHTYGDVIFPYVIINNDGKEEKLDSKNVTFSNNQIVFDLNIFGAITGTWRYAFGGAMGADSTVPGPAGVQGVSTRYAKGNISGAVAIDRTNGDYQVCTTTAAVTGITISNLATETGMVLRINNGGGYTVTWGTTEIIAATDTGSYACAFYNDNGTVCYMGKSEIR